MRTTVLFAVLVAFLTFASPARAEYAVDWSQYIDKEAARRPAPAPKQSAAKGKRAKANKKIAAKSKAKSKAKARAKKKPRRNKR